MGKIVKSGESCPLTGGAILCENPPESEKKRFIIGIAGPSGSGKSAASGILENYGFLEIDTDSLSHRILDEKKEDIVRAFSQKAGEIGLPLLDGKGNLLRKNLGILLFGNDVLLKRHEEIIYPELKKKIDTIIRENPEKHILINGAVLYKVPEILLLCRPVLYITAPLPFRVVRLLNRDKISFPRLLKRIKAQKNLFAKYSGECADIIKVNNRGNLKKLEKKLLDVLARYGL